MTTSQGRTRILNRYGVGEDLIFNFGVTSVIVLSEGHDDITIDSISEVMFQVQLKRGMGISKDQFWSDGKGLSHTLFCKTVYVNYDPCSRGDRYSILPKAKLHPIECVKFHPMELMMVCSGWENNATTLEITFRTPDDFDAALEYFQMDLRRECNIRDTGHDGADDKPKVAVVQTPTRWREAVNDPHNGDIWGRHQSGPGQCAQPSRPSHRAQRGAFQPPRSKQYQKNRSRRRRSRPHTGTPYRP